MNLFLLEGGSQREKLCYPHISWARGLLLQREDPLAPDVARVRTGWADRNLQIDIWVELFDERSHVSLANEPAGELLQPLGEARQLDPAPPVAQDQPFPGKLDILVLEDSSSFQLTPSLIDSSILTLSIPKNSHLISFVELTVHITPEAGEITLM